MRIDGDSKGQLVVNHSTEIRKKKVSDQTMDELAGKLEGLENDSRKQSNPTENGSTIDNRASNTNAL